MTFLVGALDALESSPASKAAAGQTLIVLNTLLQTSAEVGDDGAEMD